MVNAIVAAIRQAESGTTGEIRVHLKRHTRGDALSEAKKMFVRLGMHKTKARNAVLILVSPHDRTFAVIGDEGIHARVGADFWNAVRDAMLGHFRAGAVKEGIVAGVEMAGRELKRYFPAAGSNPDELANAVTES